jgi:hypothetical protein
VVFTFTTHHSQPFSGGFSPFDMFGDGGLGGLFDNMNRLMRRVVREQPEAPQEAPQEARFAEVKQQQQQLEKDEAEVKALTVENKHLAARMAQMQDLKTDTDQLLVQAPWRVNAAFLKMECMESFEAVCPDSVPMVFYVSEKGSFPRHPRGPHLGLAPVKKGAPCWMKCMKEHRDEVPFQCSVAASRMYAWAQANGEAKEFDPRMVMVGALVHFLILVLLISACIRCTYICLWMRRRRRRCGAAKQQDKTPCVSAITIQIPQRGEADLVEATVVTGTEVPEKQ